MKRKQYGLFDKAHVSITLSGDVVNQGGGVYEKELAYIGEFFPDDVSKIQITEEWLHNWVNNFRLFQASGLDVPIYIGHVQDSDPEAATKRRGTLISVEVKPNKNGVLALFGKIKFAKPEFEYLAQSQTSVHAPFEFVDGKNNKYYHPLRHVAITDNPVIPGLEPFRQTVSLSLDKPETKGKMKMTKAEIAQMLGIEEEKVTTLIQALMKILTPEVPPVDPLADPAPPTDLDTLPTEEGDPLPPPAEPVAGKTLEELQTLKASLMAQLAEVDAQIAALNTLEGETAPSETELSLRRQVAALTVQSNRARIQNALKSRKITPAQAKQLNAQYCSNATTLSLGTMQPAFNATMAILEAGQPVVNTGEYTPAQSPYQNTDQFFDAYNKAAGVGQKKTLY